MAESKEHAAVAAAAVAKLPKALRDEIEVAEGKGPYSLIKLRGRTVASVRSTNARVTYLHPGGPEGAALLAKAVTEAAGTVPAKSD